MSVKTSGQNLFEQLGCEGAAQCERERLTFKAYSEERLAAQGDIRPTDVRLALGAMGISGESAEYMEALTLASQLQVVAGKYSEHIKKYLFHGKVNLDKERCIKELGDVLWYVMFSANAIDSSLEEVAIKNNEKLRERYPNGWSVEAASQLPEGK